MRFESFHRIIKLILSHCSSHRQILKTVSIRYALALMGLQFAKYEYNYITYGPKVSDNSDIYSSNVKYAVKHVTINRFCYKKDTIIVVDYKDNMPMFGKINKIFVAEEKIIFQYLALRISIFSF